MAQRQKCVNIEIILRGEYDLVDSTKEKIRKTLADAQKKGLEVHAKRKTIWWKKKRKQ